MPWSGPWNRKFLGLTFTRQRKRAIVPASTATFKKRTRQLTKRNRGLSLQGVASELRSYLPGRQSYFRSCQTPTVPRNFDSWIHRRLRCYAWKQWKTGTRRFTELRRLGLDKNLAAQTTDSRKRYGRVRTRPGITYRFRAGRGSALNMARSRVSLIELELPLLLEPETNV